MVTVAVVGARGYLGRESLRLLLSHPHVDRVVPVSASEAGTRLGDTLPAFAHLEEVMLVAPDDPSVQEADALLLATAAGEARALVGALPDDASSIVVDLSRDHRHEGLTGTEGWTYGLPELFDSVQEGARRIANPGCYPTATLFAAAPALRAGLARPGPLIADGKSGVSGAGASPRPDLHFAETNESVRAYKVIGHDHGPEIRLACAWLEAGHPPGGTQGTRPVRFTPHLVPQNRGLLATVYLPVAQGTTTADARAAYEKAYEGAAFVRVVREPDTAHVRGTNVAHVAVDVDEECSLLVARCAIDNLVKGGAGQAVQNLNLALGVDPLAGLPRLGGGP